jgi:hypothetical protein
VTAYLTLATAAAQVSAYVLPTNIHVSPVNTSFYYFKSGGTGAEVSAAVQFTIDNLASSPNWFNVTPVAESIVGACALTFPHSAIRLNITTVSGSVAIAFGALNAGT